MKSIMIRPLHEVPELLTEVAEWIFQAFWKDKGEPDSAFLAEKLREAVSSSQIPLSFVAFFNGAPVGTINLIENDDEERPHLKPWLAALWVEPSCRKQGVASALVRNLLDEARKMKIETVYLETHTPAFYEKLGATVHEEISAGFYLMSFALSLRCS